MFTYLKQNKTLILIKNVMEYCDFVNHVKKKACKSPPTSLFNDLFIIHFMLSWTNSLLNSLQIIIFCTETASKHNNTRVTR